ncbi:5-hydroxytryptamine receptor 3A-like [Limanda limanda]|uniref:5-hydroxytryptamine receptor 3A-like n=1 Tax=Limanda limanda TaxID=27771 RepID=UPI0029C911E3|nr:5-hydroxytryptamine receptor 3A-like [Limanda limanda]
MVPVVFFVLIFLTGGTSSEKVCSYHDVLEYLNLTTENSLYKLTRPVLDHTHHTTIHLEVLLYAILAVIEKTQTFVPFIWASMKWNNELISWDPAQFCGITGVSVPKDLLWRPDLMIYEMIQKDASHQNPSLYIDHKGMVTYEEDMNVVSTCRMDVHKFPFDTQSCNISIGSAINCIGEVHLFPASNSSRATQFSRELMASQGEWEFLQLSVSDNILIYDNRSFEQLVYTFTIKRRPLLHVINFLLPILFFLSLDLASFFISDHRGEKLGFKVTVLLAISVLLLILNDILPSMSNKTPLIATYCIVIFALMLLSLLESILIIYLMEIDSKQRLKNDQEDKVKSDDAKRSRIFCSCVFKASEKETEMLPVAEEVRCVQSRESRILLLILDELQELKKTMSLHLSPMEEGGGRLFLWATRINRAFFVFYVTTVLLFLSLLYYEWKS